MKYLLIACLLVLMSLSSVIAQDEIDNGEWPFVTIADVRLRVPSTWTQLDNVFVDSVGDYLLEIQSCPTDIDDAEPSFGEQRVLPFGDAQRLQTRSEDSHMIRYHVISETACVLLEGTAPLDANTMIFDQIANTLTHAQSNEDQWSRYADSEAAILIRVPADWQREAPSPQRLTVRTTFDDVLVTIAIRDLEQAVTPEVLRDQFLTIYRSRDYTIDDVQSINLPIGDALRYDLSGVRVTSNSTHRQIHYVIMRDTYMLLATFGADERYYDEYAPLLEQIADTMQFQLPQ